MSTNVRFAPSIARADRRDVEVALLLAAAAAVLFVTALLHNDPLLSRLPRAADLAWRALGLRLLRDLSLFESGLFGLLSAVVLLRGEWLRRLDGLRLLERRPRTVLAVLAGVHVASMFFYFTPHELLSRDPAVSCDNAYHYYQLVAAHHMLSEGHHLWGYDPWFMAGYPAGVIFDLDMKGAELFCHALSGIGMPYAFKSFIVLSFVLFPVVLYGAGRLLGLHAAEALVALVLGLLFWHWGRPLLGHFRWAGMHSYILASYLSILALALFVRFVELRGRDAGGIERRAALCFAALVGVVAIACQIHPLSVLLLAPGFVTLYAVSFRRLRGVDHLALALGLGVVVAANADWILPFLRFRGYKTASNYWFQFRGLKDIAFIYTRETSMLFAAVTILGVVGLVLFRRRNPRATLALGVSAAFYFFAAFYGARFPPLANTEPGRYLVPFAFLMLLPASLALGPLLQRLQRFTGPQLAAAGLVGVASLSPFLSVADNFFFDVHRVTANVDQRFLELMGFLARSTTGDGRILFETPGGFYNSSDLFYGGHLQALVPLYTHREVIGGPYPVSFLLHSRVDFKNGELLGRRLSDWTPDDLNRFLDTYNVGWIVAWSAQARARFEASPDLTPIGTFDRFRVYALARPSGFLLEGQGHVRADYNHIDVDKATGDELVLKYHWLESLRTSPPLPLDPFPISGDPIGFIRVRTRGTTHFTIYNTY